MADDAQRTGRGRRCLGYGLNWKNTGFEQVDSAPVVNGLTARSTANGFRIVFEATDSASPIQKAAYAVNSGEWRVVYPSDGIPDSERESFDFEIEGFQEGIYTLVVKVEDSLGNAATSQVELR